MATTKITISEQYSKVLAFLESNGADESMKNFIIDRKEQHEKKNANRKPTKVQEANAELKNAIYNYIATVDKAVTVSELIDKVTECNGLSTPKVSSLVTQLKNEKKITRTEVKGKAYFSLN